MKKYKNKVQIISLLKRGNVFLLLFFLVFASLPQQTLSAIESTPVFLEKNIFKSNSNQNQNFVPGEIIIKYKENSINLKKSAGKKTANSIEKKFKLSKKDAIIDLNINLITTNQNIQDTIKVLKSDPAVEYAEPNYRRFSTTIPSDQFFSNQWALRNTGQSVNGSIGTPQSDIRASEAWESENQSQGSTTIAIIDTGVDTNHPDLIQNMWDGATCKDENNDTISGGCPEHGWNFESNNNNPQDVIGHGTFVAGIIGAQTNNNIGISGLSYYNNIKLMPIKFAYDVMSEIKAINFAKNNGAKVINASYGGSDYSQAEKDAIESFPGIFVTSAGNGNENGIGINNDITHIYPSDYTSQNIISVASTNQSDQLSSFSNYGANSVDISAPGENIYSTHTNSTNIFSENFDSSSIPTPPLTFSDSTSKWVTNLWNGSATDKYIRPGTTYSSNSDNVLLLSNPINTSTTNALRLQFYIDADIEYDQNCALDYLAIETDNNDNLWIEHERFCNYYDRETVNVNLSSAKSNTTRFRFVWHTNATNNPYLFFDTPYTPFVDDVLLSNITSSYGLGNGTSYSAPYVAGATAMVFGKFTNYSNSDVKNKILNSGDSLLSLSSKTVSGKRLNLNNALQVEPTQTTTPIYRLYNTSNGAYLYTRGTADRDHVLNTWPVFEFTDGIPAFFAPMNYSAGLTPMYRLYNTLNGAYLYARGEADKNHVMSTWPEFEFTDGAPAFYASLSQNQEKTLTPIYRLYNTLNGMYLYTRGEADKNHVMSTWPEFEFTDGIPAFYAEI